MKLGPGGIRTGSTEGKKPLNQPDITSRPHPSLKEHVALDRTSWSYAKPSGGHCCICALYSSLLIPCSTTKNQQPLWSGGAPRLFNWTIWMYQSMNECVVYGSPICHSSLPTHKVHLWSDGQLSNHPQAFPPHQLPPPVRGLVALDLEAKVSESRALNRAPSYTTTTTLPLQPH